MATAAKKDVEKKEFLEKMDRRFKISPVRMKAQDGSNDVITVEHRIGMEGNFDTLRDLMARLGLEDEHTEFIKTMNKQIKDPVNRKELIDDHYVLQKKRANRAVSEYRKHLQLFYGNFPRPLMPLFGFVSVDVKSEGLYFQGLIDAESKKLLIGDPEDAYRWYERSYVKTKVHADINKFAQEGSRALMAHPNINKDLRHRLDAIAHDRMPDQIGYKPPK